MHLSLWLIAAVISSVYYKVDSQCFTQDDSVYLPASHDLSMLLNFELNFFKQLLPKNGAENFIFSPYSVWNALVLGYFGSAGLTEVQLQKTLHLDDKMSTLRKWRLLEYFYRMRPETSIMNKFVLANRIYFDDDIFLRPCMENLLHNEVVKTDFHRPDVAAEEINTFVSDVTQGIIPGLLTPQDVQGSLMVLVNAAYFKGVWKTPFDPMLTMPRPFFTPNGDSVLVHMMMTDGEFQYGFDDYLEAEFIDLPYNGDTISMLIFLPYETDHGSMNKFMKRITPNSFKRAMANSYVTQLQVLMPKFKIETNLGDDLIQGLLNIGLISPFDPLTANFTLFAPYMDGVFLDKSIHKAFISVNEEGTEASAATAFVATKTLGSTFRCDRSFVFAIRDNETKNLLFIGAYKGPGVGEVAVEPVPSVIKDQPAGPFDGISQNREMRFNF